MAGSGCARAFALLLLGTAFVGLCGAVDQVDTTGKTIEGWKFTKNIEPYRHMSLVYQEMVDLLAAGKRTQALKVFNTKGISGWVPARTFLDYATADPPNKKGSWVKLGDPTHKLYAKFYNSNNYIKNFVGDMSDPVKAEAGLLWVVFALANNQLDRVTIYQKMPGLFQTGVNEVEDTYGTIIGYPSYPCLRQFHADVGSKCGGGSINGQVFKLLQTLHAAAKRGATAEILKHKATYLNLQARSFLRAILWKVSLGKAAEQARARWYLTIIQPLLKDQTSAKALLKLLAGTALTDTKTVAPLVKAIADTQGFTATCG